MQITAQGEFSVLCTFLETLLTMIWYPTTVATLSRRARDVVEQSFECTSDLGRGSPLIQSRLQDFGFRGCTSVEQSVIGGCAHLLSFNGSDTMSAAFYAQVCMCYVSLSGAMPVFQRERKHCRAWRSMCHPYMHVKFPALHLHVCILCYKQYRRVHMASALHCACAAAPP